MQLYFKLLGPVWNLHHLVHSVCGTYVQCMLIVHAMRVDACSVFKLTELLCLYEKVQTFSLRCERVSVC